MSQNPTSLTLSSDRLSAIDGVLSTLEQNLAGLIALDAHERRTLVKIGDKSETFAWQSTLLGQNTQLVSPSFNLSEARNDLTMAEARRPRLVRLRQLLERADDTETALGSNLISAALKAVCVAESVWQGRGLEQAQQPPSARLSHCEGHRQPNDFDGKRKHPTRGAESLNAGAESFDIEVKSSSDGAHSLARRAKSFDVRARNFVVKAKSSNGEPKSPDNGVPNSIVGAISSTHRAKSLVRGFRVASLVALMALGAGISACMAGDSLADAQAPGSAPAALAATVGENHAGLKIPNHFIAYASEPIDGHKLCVVGAITDDDGMNQRPLAYEADAANKRVIWIAHLDLPADMFQSRATHCNQHGDALNVLLQSDTQSEESLSQTLLRVVKLDTGSGAVQRQQDVDVPTAYSAWVEKGSNHFQWDGDRLVVTGNQRLDSDHDRQAAFTMRLNGDLKP